MEADNNYQFNYQKLLSFLTRKNQKGYVFAKADNYRLIQRINKSLTEDVSSRGLSVSTIYLDQNSDTPLVTQIENAAERAGALIIANLYEVVNHDEKGSRNLTHINFSREALWALNKPLVFWADVKSMHTIANQAPDLFSQRRHTTIHFTDTEPAAVIEKIKRDGLETFLSSEKFTDTQTDIAILKRRLNDAQNSGYPNSRIAWEIALPLAKEYAQLDLADDAKKLLELYKTEWETEDEGLLEELAEVYYLLHDYGQAIGTLENANKIIENKYKEVYPEKWFINVVNLSDWLTESGQPERILDKLEAADRMLTNKFKINNIQDRTSALIKERLANIFLDRGELKKARNYFEDSLKIREQLCKSNPLSEQLQRDLSISYEKLGNIEQALGGLQKARNYFEDSLKIREQLCKSNPLSEQLQRDLSISYEKLGNIEQALGGLQKARNYFEDSLKISEKLCRSNPLSEQLQRDLSVNYDELGNIEQALGELQKACNYFVDSLKIREKLCKNNPLSELLQRDLSISYEKLGNIEQALGELQKAHNYFEDSLKIREQLCKSNPLSEELQRDLSISYNKLVSCHAWIDG